jgi:membrane-bound inhibitor of C-type lysozyme
VQLTCRWLALAATLLSGCQSVASQPAASTPPTRYLCTDGRVIEARYPDSVTALLALRGHSYTLKVARSADGARYVGDGWQWWAKGMRDGTLAPLARGETIATSPGVQCHAS